MNLSDDSAQDGFSLEDWVGHPAEEVYGRLQHEDPFHIVDVCRACMRDNGYLLDVSVLHEEAQREVAFECEIGSPEDTPNNWIELAVLHAAHRILQRDRDLENQRAPADLSGHPFIVNLFALAPERGRSSSVAYHALPTRIRRIFQALVLEDLSLAEATEHGLGHASELLPSIVTVFEAVGARIESVEMPSRLRGEG